MVVRATELHEDKLLEVEPPILIFISATKERAQLSGRVFTPRYLP